MCTATTSAATMKRATLTDPSRLCAVYVTANTTPASLPPVPPRAPGRVPWPSSRNLLQLNANTAPSCQLPSPPAAPAPALVPPAVVPAAAPPGAVTRHVPPNGGALDTVQGRAEAMVVVVVVVMVVVVVRVVVRVVDVSVVIDVVVTAMSDARPKSPLAEAGSRVVVVVVGGAVPCGGGDPSTAPGSTSPGVGPVAAAAAVVLAPPHTFVQASYPSLSFTLAVLWAWGIDVFNNSWVVVNSISFAPLRVST